MFLETPYDENNVALYEIWLVQMINHNKTLLEFLKKNNNVLYEIARNFEINYNDANIVCFYKNKKTLYEPWQTQICRL